MLRSRRRPRKPVPAPIRMSYAEAGVYLNSTLAQVQTQIRNGTITVTSALEQWEAACAFIYAATSEHGYRVNTI